MTKKKSFLNSKLKNAQAYSCVAVTEKERKVIKPTQTISSLPLPPKIDKEKNGF
jgi:hypothetical protein